MLYPLIQALWWAGIAAIVVVVVGPVLVVVSTRAYLGLRWLYRRAFKIGLAPELKRQAEERRRLLAEWENHARKE